MKDANFKNLFNKDKLKDYPAITLKVSLSSQLLQEHTKSVVKNVLNSLTDEVYNENIDSLIKVEEENLSKLKEQLSTFLSNNSNTIKSTTKKSETNFSLYEYGLSGILFSFVAGLVFGAWVNKTIYHL